MMQFANMADNCKTSSQTIRSLAERRCTFTVSFWGYFSLILFLWFHLKIRVKQPHSEDRQGDSKPDKNRETECCCEVDQVRIKTSQDVKYNVYRDGIFDSTSAVTYPTEEQSDCKGINTLHQIHVENTEQQRLPDICSPERHCMARISECQAAEDDFFHDRCNDYRVKDQHNGCIFISNCFHQGIVLHDPFRTEQGDNVDHKYCDILQSHCQKNNGGNGVETESGWIISFAFPERFYKYVPIPNTEQDQCGNAVQDIDCLQKILICRDRHQGVRQGTQITAAFIEGFYSVYDHHRDRDSKLSDNCDQEWDYTFKKITGFFHGYSSNFYIL